MDKKIKIAFIKFAGLSSGGTEKFLQTVASNISKELFDVTYFYSDTKPLIKSSYKFSDTDINRVKYMQDHGVKLIKFDFDYVNDYKRTRDWINTDFWRKFSETEYDIIQTGKAGFPEYPFTKIKKTPIVDSLHLLAGVDNQYNISRVMHITKWSAKKWTSMGGDKNRVVVVSHPMDINAEVNNLRTILKMNNEFIFGFHQRSDDGIFSPIPLEAYKKIETEKTYFIIMGGSRRYTEQAKKLDLNNFIQLNHSGNSQDIYDFLQTLNVYAHGRKDGEVNSTAIAEAMYFGLPIVSHTSDINNGHIECIGEAGLVAKNIEEYSVELNKLMSDKNYYQYRSKKSKERFQEKYELKNQIKIIENIYFDVIKNPFPNPVKRRLSSLRLYYRFIYFFPRLFKFLKRKIDKVINRNV